MATRWALSSLLRSSSRRAYPARSPFTSRIPLPHPYSPVPPLPDTSYPSSPSMLPPPQPRSPRHLLRPRRLLVAPEARSRTSSPVPAGSERFHRVHESGGSDGDRFRGDGVRWVLYQAHLHPHQ
ncbi:hypothetical protein J5N97_009971 [Dioscorea zingiberensis]|uniref:Uncharacterized protein n=1 Tax=Dioscorea zingiberensis TaxID=325984 RepID=A0A9D5CY77_9LILI|nr:hypothetical protein J5N97_009971 [Dioscorea zingiberensis]